ncbi:MAG: nucleotidyltransferase family protein [Candidatus Heimdallarchaeaceae archaeon]
MDAIILCGGLGTRIRTVTQDSYPKAMVRIQGKTILEWELAWLKKHGINFVILAVRHLADYIKEQLGTYIETENGKIEIAYSKEPEKLGSGGAVRLASQYISTKDVIVMNGDILTNFNLKDMIEHYNKSECSGSIGVAKMRSPYGIVEINDKDIIQEFREKPLLDHWIHAGVDIFKKDVLPDFPKKGQMEDTIFVQLAERRELIAYKIDPRNYWRSIDTAKDFETAEKEWPGI